MLWAISLGVFFNLLNFSWDPLIQLSTKISDSTVFLVMLMLGLECHLKWIDIKKVFLFLGLKYTLGLGVAWVIVQIFALEEMSKTVVYVAALLPPSVVTLIFAQENDLDTAFLSSVLSVALPLSILLLPWVILHL